MDFQYSLTHLRDKSSKDERIRESTSSLSGDVFYAALALASTHTKSIPEVIFFLHSLFPVQQRCCTEGRPWQGLCVRTRCVYFLCWGKKKKEKRRRSVST